jgi:uncharacterized phage-like protein YoqJ
MSPQAFFAFDALEELVVACTGHRPDDDRPWHGVGTWADVHIHQGVQEWLDEQLVKLMAQAERERRRLRIIAGGAVGVDTWWFQAGLRRGVPVTLAQPFAGQELEWPHRAQCLYRELMAQAFEVVNVSGHNEYLHRQAGHRLPLSEVRKLMHQRDRWMVDRCHLLLGVWTGAPGGTGITMQYAEKVKRERWRLDPSIFRERGFRGTPSRRLDSGGQP